MLFQFFIKQDWFFFPPVLTFSLFLDAQMSKENTTEECALLEWAESTHSSQMYVAF